MAFDARNLAFALVAHQGDDGQLEGLVGARVCGGTQNPRAEIPFDDIANGEAELKSLKATLQSTIEAIDKKLAP